MRTLSRKTTSGGSMSETLCAGLAQLLAAIHANDPKREILVRIGYLMREAAALPHLQAQEWQIERAKMLSAFKHIVAIPENVPGGLTVREAMMAMVAMAQSTINKAEAGTLIAEQREVKP